MVLLNEAFCGYLDVKISARSRRGFTPWKAWQKRWCEVKKLDSIENGVELTLRTSQDGSLLKTLLLPRSCTICRTESRTKQFAFGAFALGRCQKPLLFLSGSSEHDSQTWIGAIRRMLSIATYLPIGESNFHISIVDNVHSRQAGLVGLFGVLGTTSQEILISDPCTGDPKISWKWSQFHQFHLQASCSAADDKKICVMHTSGDFSAGPGQLYLYCKQAPSLLNKLISHGKSRGSNGVGGGGLLASKRLSCSEGDLYETHGCKTIPDSPLWLRSQTGSDDSGVRVSLTSDDTTLYLSKCKQKESASLFSLGLNLMTTTPGGSETNDSTQDLTSIIGDSNLDLSRRESGISIASGIYEEILESSSSSSNKKEALNHVYENPIDLIISDVKSLRFKPPPLPPRQHRAFDSKTLPKKLPNYKQRCNTLPAKDLARMSQIFTSESDYMVMSSIKTVQTKDKNNVEENNTTMSTTTLESIYIPMSKTS